jgi:hypothetical protein
MITAVPDAAFATTVWVLLWLAMPGVFIRHEAFMPPVGPPLLW